MTSTYNPYTQPLPSEGDRPAFAGFFARLGARILDTIVLLLMLLPVVGVVIAIWVGAPKHLTSCTVNSEPGFCRVPNAGPIIAMIVVGVIGYFGVFFIMYGRWLGRRGFTPGQRAMGIKVIEARSGLPIGTARGIGRVLCASFISGSILGLGYLWMLWDPNKQTWHDKMVGSWVIKAR